MKDSIPDLRDKWPERLERVRRSQARTDPRGMTRPPRDPVEREFLRHIGGEGPFVEDPPPGVRYQNPLAFNMAVMRSCSSRCSAASRASSSGSLEAERP